MGNNVQPEEVKEFIAEALFQLPGSGKDAKHEYALLRRELMLDRSISRFAETSFGYIDYADFCARALDPKASLHPKNSVLFKACQRFRRNLKDPKSALRNALA